MNKQQTSSQMISVEIKTEKRVYQREDTVAVRENKPSKRTRNRRNKKNNQKTKTQSFWKMKYLKKWINEKNAFLIIAIIALSYNMIVSNKDVSNLELIVTLQFIQSIIFGKSVK